MSNDFTHIEPLIVNLQEQGRSVQVMFQCPMTGHQFSGRASAARDHSLGSKVKKNTQQSLLYAAQRALSQVLREVFGHNSLGRMASDVTRRTMYSASSQMMNGLSTKEKEQAIVKAFQSVRQNFMWDENHMRWISKQGHSETVSGFDKQRQEHAISHPYDLQVLSRMMVEIAMVDGHMDKSEREWLAMLLNPEHGTMEQISQHPPLSSAELANTSTGDVRVTMLMIAWAIALCDENLDSSEQQRLRIFTHGLQLSSTKEHTARTLAQTYILENAIQYIYQSSLGNGAFNRQQILTLASKIGVTEATALDVEAKVKRRQSNF